MSDRAEKRREHDERVGTLLREARVAKKMTQDDVGARLELTAPAIAKYEKGETSTTLFMFTRFAKVLGFDRKKFLSRIW